jgi:hypothetical protein
MAKNRKQKQQAAEKRRQKEIVRKAQISEKQVNELAEKRANAPVAPAAPRSRGTFSVEQPTHRPDRFWEEDEEDGLRTTSAKPPSDDSESPFWNLFASADLEGKVQIFLNALEAGDIEAGFAFDIFDMFKHELPDTPAGHARFAELVYLLRDKAAQAYFEDMAYLHQTMLTHAIEDNRHQDIAELLVPYVDESDLDIYFQVIDQVSYHGLQTGLVEAIQQNVPTSKKQGGGIRFSSDYLQGKVMRLTLWDYLSDTPSPSATDPLLRQTLQPLGEFDPGWLERFIPRWTATQPPAWTLDDFGPQVDAEQWETNLHNLLADFMAERHHAGIPFARLDLAWEQISTALIRQLGNSANIPTKRKALTKKASARMQTPRSPLVPGIDALNETLKSITAFMGGRPYALAATLELLPAYLHFIARLGLLHPAEMDDALTDLHSLTDGLQKFFTYHGVDKICAANVFAAWSPEAQQRIQADPALQAARAQAAIVLPTVSEVLPHAPTTAYTFLVTYDRDPEIWRKVEMLGKQTLYELHQIIQQAVSFDNDHPHAFFMSNIAWDSSTQYPVMPDRGQTGSRQKSIFSLGLRMKQRFLYIFDYGDEHRFEIQLLEMTPDAPKADYPRILEAHGENPPQYDYGDDEDWDDDNEEEEDA